MADKAQKAAAFAAAEDAFEMVARESFERHLIAHAEERISALLASTQTPTSADGSTRSSSAA